jgi:CBS domain containing-hemolysin-like protein
MNPTLLPVRIAAVLLALGAAIGLRLLATAIRRLDPQTRALAEARSGRGAEDEAFTPDEPRILHVLERFVRAAGDLEAGALLALAMAAASAASAFPHWLGMSLSLAFSFGLMPALLGVLPERLAAGRVSAVLGRAAPGILLLAWLFHPIVILRDLLLMPFERLLGEEGRHRSAPGARPVGGPPAPPEPARTAAPAAGVTRSGSGLRQVLGFARATVHQVMTPRDEIVAIESGSSLRDLVQVVATTHRGSYPIYRSTLDDIVGQVSVSDLLTALPPDATVDQYRRDAVVVPESKRVAELALEMRTRGYSMVMVIDEFGSVSGLANLHDVVGILVGEMAEAGPNGGNAGEFEVRRLDLHTWILNPHTRLERVNEILGLALPEGDYHTIAGFILDQLGRIPLPRERLRVAGGEFEILEADARRIQSIRFRRPVPGGRS